MLSLSAKFFFFESGGAGGSYCNLLRQKKVPVQRLQSKAKIIN
jgi:hypothetical protein